MVKHLKNLFLIIIFLAIAVFLITKVKAIECDVNVNPNNLSTSELGEYSEKCKEKLNSLGQQANSLSQQIQYMDTQIYLTTLQIQETEQKILDTGKEIDIIGTRIDGLDKSLDYISKQLLNRIVIGYKQRSLSLFSMLFDTVDAGDLLTKIKYQKTTQDNDQKLLVQVQEAKSNFEEQKKLRETKKTELDQLTVTLQNQKASLKTQQNSKQVLLAETQNNETIYQNLFNQAQALIAGFSKFTSSQGGSSILSNQTVCDSWGCYYNQRDSQWGNNSLNGTRYTLASDGCLITSMAMIYTHYGHKEVNPQTINSVSSNFASYYPAYLNFTIIANGVSSTRINSAIDSELSQGRPVVVQISMGGNDFHFVVLISGSGGNYQMNDPYVENGHNIAFTSKYPIGSIITVQKVTF